MNTLQGAYISLAHLAVLLGVLCQPHGEEGLRWRRAQEFERID